MWPDSRRAGPTQALIRRNAHTSNKCRNLCKTNQSDCDCVRRWTCARPNHQRNFSTLFCARFRPYVSVYGLRVNFDYFFRCPEVRRTVFGFFFAAFSFYLDRQWNGMTASLPGNVRSTWAFANIHRSCNHFRR